MVIRSLLIGLLVLLPAVPALAVESPQDEMQAPLVNPDEIQAPVYNGEGSVVRSFLFSEVNDEADANQFGTPGIQGFPDSILVELDNDRMPLLIAAYSEEQVPVIILEYNDEHELLIR